MKSPKQTRITASHGSTKQEFPPPFGCYRQALALIHELRYPLTRALMVSMLTELGDACQASGNPPDAVEAWQQATPSRRGSRRCRSSTTWDGPTSRELAPDSSRPATTGDLSDGG
jgi:hypothetical protein